MKIVLIGCGKMGKAIETIAVKRGHEITLKVSSENCKSINPEDLAGADVALEFTRPDVAFDNVIKCIDAHVPVVCGTTGWFDRIKEAEDYCLAHNGSLFYSINFSIGVNLFFEINLLLAELMNSQPQYDEVFIHESHHAGKLDSPSGTAISLAKQILSQVKRLSHYTNYKTDESMNLSKDEDNELPIFSTREEDITGTHIVKYFSDVDEIELVHKAISRDGFALGAVSAAEWLRGKKGVFGMKDLLNL